MANIITFPQINPIKFYKQADDLQVNASYSQALFNPNYNSRNVDEDFMYRNLKSWQNKVGYFQPFQNSDVINLQFVSILDAGFHTVRLINEAGVIVKSIACIRPITLPSTEYVIQCSIKLWDVPEGNYFVQIQSLEFTGAYHYVLSEPISIKAIHENTLLFKYFNSKNDQSIFYETGIVFYIRLNASFTELNPMNKVYGYEDMNYNRTLVSGVPYREFTLVFGQDGDIMPEWIADKANRIFMCDNTAIDGKLYTISEGAKLEPKRIEGNPNHQWKINLREKNNDTDLVVISTIPQKIPTLLPIILDDENYFYIKELLHGSGLVSINKVFSSVVEFVNYLNQNIFPFVTDAFFYVDDNGYLWCDYSMESGTNLTWLDNSFNSTTSSAVLRNPCNYGVKLTVKNGTGASINLTTIANDYAVKQYNGTVNLYTGVILPTINIATAGTNEVIICYKDIVNFKFNKFSTASVSAIALDGRFPPKIKEVNLIGFNLVSINNNLFLWCEVVFTGLLLSTNYIGSTNIDDLIIWIYAKANLFTTSPTLNNQTPLAPPSYSTAMSNFKALNGVGIITD